jgi:hypothetical protein
MPEIYRRKRVVHAMNRKLQEGKSTSEYLVKDTNWRPGSFKRFGGVQAYLGSKGWCVRMSQKQARFYLDSGALEPV